LDLRQEAAARHGAFTWRAEAFDVRAVPEGAVLAAVDRGALPWLGIAAQGVHVNGLVRRASGLWVWVGRRAAHKLLDPGKFDHIVAGGVPAGLSSMQTLVKEAQEEAGIPPSVAANAVLALLERVPEGGGSPVVEVPLAIQDRTVTVGNIPLAKLPMVIWPDL